MDDNDRYGYADTEQDERGNDTSTTLARMVPVVVSESSQRIVIGSRRYTVRDQLFSNRYRQR